mmetsp:Transcript_30567/g.95013  ORF Transcript_30567/g.95013 Transcript_30567/m.95013 type:complete len:220 (+) Transcript_30567:428-1087(+)
MLVRSTGYIIALRAPMHAMAKNCQPVFATAKRLHITTALAPAIMRIDLASMQLAMKGMTTIRPTAFAAKKTDSSAPMVPSDQRNSRLQYSGQRVTPDEIASWANIIPPASTKHLGNFRATSRPPKGLALPQVKARRRSCGRVSGCSTRTLKRPSAPSPRDTTMECCGPTMLETTPPKGGPMSWPIQMALSRTLNTRARSMSLQLAMTSAAAAMPFPVLP